MANCRTRNPGMLPLLALASGLAVRCAAAPGEPGPWLNVQECGASGSRFETTGVTTAGSNRITLADAGDFKVGQGVMLSRADIRYTRATLWGPNDSRSNPLKEDVMEIRGYEGSAGSWLPFLLEIDPAAPAHFRWTDDIGRTWHAKAPITGGWQPLSGRVEVRFRRREWDGGYAISFSARDQLVTAIEKIEGNTITLRDAANRSARDAVLRHRDDTALQAAIDQALRERRHVFVPPGWYRLAQGVTVRDAGGITIEGGNGVDSVLDISDGEGACFSLRNGTEVTLRNFRLVGHTGFAERDQCGWLRMPLVASMWGMFVKGCSAVDIRNTERVLIENCHASRMATECFYSEGSNRTASGEPRQYTKAITYLRCSATDCGRNAFNNNDMAENTSVLHCRIVDVGGCAWEGASRFVKFIGNYVRNSGTVAMGNICSRDASFEELPSGQHIIADNVFESVVPYGDYAVCAAVGATPVVIANNLFVNFGSSAVKLDSFSGPGLPACNGTVTSNIFDMTEIGPESKARCAIDVSVTDAIIGSNQIYVRGTSDAQVTAIRIREPALNVNVHDNLIRNCGTGIATARAQARVQEVVDAQTFAPAWGYVPMERRRSHLYRGWNLVWIGDGKPVGTSVIDVFDPETMRFKLKEPRQMKVWDAFEVFPATGANWNIHDNTLTGCLNPAVLDCYGSETSLFKGNIITRGEATGVRKAVVVGGRFSLIGNHISGFNEPGAAALALQPDPLGRACRNLIRGNIIERCATAVMESRKGLWTASSADGNLFVECGRAPANSTQATH